MNVVVSIAKGPEPYCTIPAPSNLVISVGLPPKPDAHILSQDVVPLPSPKPRYQNPLGGFSGYGG